MATAVLGLSKEPGYDPPKKEYDIDTSMIISILSIEGENSNSILRMIENPSEAPIEPTGSINKMTYRLYDFKLRGWKQKNALRYHNAKIMSILDLIQLVEECTFELEFEKFQGSDYLTGINITHPEYNYDFQHWEERLISAVQKDINGTVIHWWSRDLEVWDNEDFTDNERLISWRIFCITVKSLKFYIEIEYDSWRLVNGQ